MATGDTNAISIPLDADVRVLGLDQPWASLWALGIKTIETRGAPWPKTIPLPPDGAWVIVHANVKRPVMADVGDWHAVRHPARHFHLARVGNISARHRLPLGAVVGAVHVTDSLPILPVASVIAGGHDRVISRLADSLQVVRDGEPREVVSDQLPYGDFTPGRWGYLSDVQHALAEPIPWRCGQGWSQRAPRDLIEAVNAQIGAA